MGVVLVVLGLGGTLVGLVSLFRPLGLLRLTTRKRAAGLIAATLATLGVGVVMSTAVPAPAPLLALPATTTTPATPTTTTTTAPRVSTTTSTAATTSSIPTTVAEPEDTFGPPVATSSGNPAGPLPTGAETVTVLSITDGDTLDVRLEDGTVETVRLIGVNTPESGECWFEESSRVLATLTPVGADIGMTGDVSNRDQYGRLLRYLWVGGLSVNRELVRRGAAISRRYPPDTAMASLLEYAQGEAQDKTIGLWAPDACGPSSDADLEIVELVYDAPGDDNQNLNGETVVVGNMGDKLVDLTGWGLKDESASHRYTFPDGFALIPGKTVTVHSGCGEDFGQVLYWCVFGSAIWNNDGDTAFLTDPYGNIHTSFSYTAPTTTSSSETTATKGGGGNCDTSYPTVCIPSPPPDLDCGEIPYENFKVVGSDPHGFDGDNDGIGCES